MAKTVHNPLSLYKHMDFFFFDEDFVLEKDMRKLGFRKSTTDGLFNRILDSVYAIQDDLYNTDIKNVRREANAWKKDLKKALSKDVGDYKHKRRPSKNPFPMMNTGELRDSLYVNVRDTSKRKAWEFELSVGFKSPNTRLKDHVVLTNYNITRSGLNTRNVKWYLWMDDVFNKGKSGLVSVKDLMYSVLD